MAQTLASFAMAVSMLAPSMPAVPHMPRLGTTMVASPPLLLPAIASRSSTRCVRLFKSRPYLR